MIPEEAEHRFYRANRELDAVDDALARLRTALEDVDDAIRRAKERGAWSS